MKTIHLLSRLRYSVLDREMLATPLWEELLSTWLPLANINCSHMLDHILETEARQKARKCLRETHRNEKYFCVCSVITLPYQ